ncbi:MAG: ribonucrease, partial [Cryptosporangiaceae bacterium]|nr:ribonucrease [Cryptosporangiaceae bacterium]
MRPTDIVLVALVVLVPVLAVIGGIGWYVIRRLGAITGPAMPGAAVPGARPELDRSPGAQPGPGRSADPVRPNGSVSAVVPVQPDADRADGSRPATAITPGHPQAGEAAHPLPGQHGPDEHGSARPGSGAVAASTAGVPVMSVPTPEPGSPRVVLPEGNEHHAAEARRHEARVAALRASADEATAAADLARAEAATGKAEAATAKAEAAAARAQAERIVAAARTEADELIERARRKSGEDAADALAAARRAAEGEASRLTAAVKSEQAEIDRRAQRLNEREERIDTEQSRLEHRDRELAEAEERLAERESELVTAEDEKLAALERIAGLSADAAKAELVKSIETQAKREAAILIRDIEADARGTGELRARNIVVDAIQRVASEQTAESVVSVLHLPSDEMKGRIIGREGRNIRAYESVTGVNLIIDDTPEAVLLSCFDPVRREIGRLTLEKLVLDGRIHPHRIEEVYEQSKVAVEQLCVRAGEDALVQVGITDMHPELIELLGRLRYRTSYGQNVLKHLIETAHIAGLMASELRMQPA